METKLEKTKLFFDIFILKEYKAIDNMFLLDTFMKNE